MFQEISNDINNAINHWVLTPQITLWSLKSPLGLHFPKWELPWECKGSLPHTPSHFLTFPGICDVILGLSLGLHPCNPFALTLGLSLGPQPCNPFALVVSPRLGLQHFIQDHEKKTWDIRHLQKKKKKTANCPKKKHETETNLRS
jgi:hypothetical protein